MADSTKESPLPTTSGLKQRYNFENIVGKSEPMLKIFDLVAQVATSRSTVGLGVARDLGQRVGEVRFGGIASRKRGHVRVGVRGLE